MSDYSFGDELNEALTNQALREMLRETNVKLAKQKNRTEALAEAAYEGAASAVQSMGKMRPITRPKLKSGPGGEEHALWHMTDWQGAKETVSYNSPIMWNRVQEFTEIAYKITEIQRKAHPVSNVTVAFGGDMVEGLFNFPSQPFEIDATIYEQYVGVARLIERTLRRAAGMYETVHAIGEWGNHGRIGSKRSAVPRSDNFDRMCYRLAEEMTKDEPRILWTPQGAEDIQRIEIGNYRALLIHGDEVGRNGFASPMTIVQHVNRWRSGAYRWDFRDVYMGHYHTHAEWPLANGLGAVYQTGSTESDNRYARDNLASSAIPSQRLHFIDPERGRVTAQYKITLT